MLLLQGRYSRGHPDPAWPGVPLLKRLDRHIRDQEDHQPSVFRLQLQRSVCAGGLAQSGDVLRCAGPQQAPRLPLSAEQKEGRE